MIEVMLLVSAVCAAVWGGWALRSLTMIREDRGAKLGEYRRGWKVGFRRGKIVATSQLWAEIIAHGVSVGRGRNRQWWVSVPVEFVPSAWLELDDSGKAAEIDDNPPPHE